MSYVPKSALQRGQSAYELAVEQGFVGTLEDWIHSLRGFNGQDGKDGKDGKDGEKGEKGDKGDKGERGEPGPPGNANPNPTPVINR
jgi:hypothetical protein